METTLWDLTARVLGIPLYPLLGAVRQEVPLYGSGGLTSYGDADLRDQLHRWVHEEGLGRVKIKIGESRGTRERRDLERVESARSVIGADAELFVDANGAYTAKQAIRVARGLDAAGVRWPSGVGSEGTSASSTFTI